MSTSLAIIILLGLLANQFFKKLKLPGLLGMLILGVIIGPYGLNLIAPEILNISSDLRKIALIIILLRAGFGISRNELKRVGNTALKLGCIPGIIEGFTIAVVSTKVLGFSFIEGGILGFIIAAVSPAVVVPQMLDLIQKGIGSKKGVPTLMLAGSSIDDVFAITIFGTFMGLYSGKNINIAIQILGIPLSIILGVILGLITALVIIKIFNKYHINDTQKVLVVLSGAILLTSIEVLLEDKIEIASLLGVMTIGFIMREKTQEMYKKLADSFNKIWVFAQILLFVLVGAQVNISVAFESGTKGLIIILIGLVARSIGVFLSVLGTDLNYKERLFCIISYIPKATVQAAIGAVPLAVGVVSGDIILAIAVLSILITAPVGALLISVSSKKLLDTEECDVYK
ncbi:cation:proton antiporter [Tepidibacter thalassicus]|uniref:Sodium/proton antiporter, CPA1 family n=1 Tax=Tepidibacter thalassicus DSM 15285 TaxID=1123350 RepID=A0A1M5SCV9_9FIRM|nr:cation:proton antiporter [Tepidibacter thalassicus]SHH36346.1 sodium/proton antiporter, CPA1 family [Tepidibacter thalassicus DSM 15285]